MEVFGEAEEAAHRLRITIGRKGDEALLGTHIDSGGVGIETVVR
jgi:hypothetical protein